MIKFYKHGDTGIRKAYDTEKNDVIAVFGKSVDMVKNELIFADEPFNHDEAVLVLFGADYSIKTFSSLTLAREYVLIKFSK